MSKPNEIDALRYSMKYFGEGPISGISCHRELTIAPSEGVTGVFVGMALYGLIKAIQSPRFNGDWSGIVKVEDVNGTTRFVTWWIDDYLGASENLPKGSRFVMTLEFEGESDDG